MAAFPGDPSAPLSLVVTRQKRMSVNEAVGVQL